MTGAAPRRVVVRAARIARFLAWFVARLVVANLVVAREILTPGSGLQPAVVRVPLRSRTDTEVALVALCVTLTPGTLTLAVRRDPRVMWVHGMYAADAEAFRRTLAELEERLLAAARPVAGATPVGRAGTEGRR
ncbi:Na+/H+ antiporter subunit E [Micromonospora sp. NPDC047707]|uniref:Na+/H+ antiporter subunit E n=1 Tax=unclassified Micromonospora TaxID=2617518 RepID=UPI0012B4F095|nr:Na+/H+ antiporter subunit E [Micromonospora sp. WMMC415]QGN47691.1 cation transporter [Micromonospora sp. WMMC415]